jgi:hypothetical protein
MDNLVEILHKLGYTNLKSSGPVFRTRPLYRDSGNNQVLCIFKDTGYFKDHGREEFKGSLEELVRLTLSLSSHKEACQWLGVDYKKINYKPVEVIKYIEQDKIFDKENLSLIKPIHDYWNDRKISNDTLNNFKSGIDNGTEGGKMQNRYVFPIFDDKDNIIGLSGRKLEAKSNRPKWIHYGKKSKWIYPSFINKNHVKDQEEVILVESIGDMLSLWEAGIKNSVVLFGVNLSDSILFYLIGLRVKKIVIALNNDGENKAGNSGAEKISKDLKNYFEESYIKIALPDKNDFNEMSENEILNWKKNV